MLERPIEVRAADISDSDFFFLPGWGVVVGVSGGEGVVKLGSVRFVDAGRFVNPKQRVPGLTLGADAGASITDKSLISDCVFTGGKGPGIRLASAGTTVQGSVVLDALGDNFEVLGQASLRRNLAMGGNCMDGCAACCGKWHLNFANFEFYFTDGVEFTDNAAAGGIFGFKFNVAPPRVFSGNTAHSNMFGVAVNYEKPLSKTGADDRFDDTIRLKDAVLWRSWEFALWGHAQASLVLVENVTIVDSKAGMSWGAVGPSSLQHIIGEHRIYVRNLLLLGRSDGNAECGSWEPTEGRPSSSLPFAWVAGRPQVGMVH